MRKDPWVVAPQSGITAPASEVRVGQQPVVEPLAPLMPPSLELPRDMQITAAFHRPVETRANIYNGMFPADFRCFRYRNARGTTWRCARCQSP